MIGILADDIRIDDEAAECMGTAITDGDDADIVRSILDKLRQEAPQLSPESRRSMLSEIEGMLVAAADKCDVPVSLITGVRPRVDGFICRVSEGFVARFQWQ